MELTIKIYYGGLGDHLLHSHLPKIAKEKFGYDKVFISNKSNYNNPNTKRLVWEYNPYIDGFNDNDHGYPTFGGVVEGKNILDAVADFYGLSTDLRYIEPEVYYKPKLIPELKDAIIFEPNHGNNYGIPTYEQTMDYLKDKNITHEMKHPTNKSTNIIIAPTQEELCDVIYSCKEFYCYTSGVATLSAALGKPITVLYIKGINPMFHHSKLHKYVEL